MKYYAIFLLLFLFSCEKRTNITEYYFLKAKNNTNYSVTLNYFTRSDSSFLNSFIIEPQSISFLDTNIISVAHSRLGKDRITVVKGEENKRTPYWRTNTNLMYYKFEDFKLSITQHTPGGECDTSDVNSILLCNFMKRTEETKEATETRDLEIIETATFYITQHQLAAADSI